MSLFAEKLLKRTKALAHNVIFLCRKFHNFPESKTIQNQLIKSATSTAANYRAACRGRSKNEWYSKISIVVEEIDETNFWLDFIVDLELVPKEDLLPLIKESEELTKIFAKARATAKKNKYNLEEPIAPYFFPLSGADQKIQ